MYGSPKMRRQTCFRARRDLASVRVPLRTDACNKVSRCHGSRQLAVLNYVSTGGFPDETAHDVVLLLTVSVLTKLTFLYLDVECLASLVTTSLLEASESVSAESLEADPPADVNCTAPVVTCMTPECGTVSDFTLSVDHSILNE